MRHHLLIIIAFLWGLADFSSAQIDESSINPLLLEKMGLEYFDKNDFQRAEQYLTQALMHYQARYGIKNERCASVLINLGNLYMQNQNNEAAETCFIKARDICAETTGKKSTRYALATANLGALYIKSAMVERGEMYTREAADIYAEIIGKNTIDYARTQNTLGGYYFLRGEMELAHMYLSNTLLRLDSIQTAPTDSSALYGKNQLYLSALINLGAVYVDSDPKQALDIYQKTLKLIQDMALEGSEEHMKIKLNIANIAREYGEFNLAEKFYQSVLTYREQTPTPSYYQNIIIYRNLVLLYAAKNDLQKIALFYRKLENACKMYFIQSINYMTEDQRREISYTITGEYESDFPQFTAFYYPQNHAIAGWGYNNELFAKGMLLQSTDAVKNSILRCGDTTLIQQWEKLVSLKQKMAMQSNDTDLEFIQENKLEVEQLEKEITRKSATYRENMRQWNITWDSVKATLKPNQVAIEYMRAPMKEDRTMYCALLLRDTCSYPIMIPLFEEKEVTQLIEVSIPSSISKAYSYRENGKELSRLVWSKVLPYINPGEIVFFAPTGLLHEVAMESIPYDSTQVISDVYNLVRLSSTRELVINRPAIPHKKATLHGGISYDVSADELLAQSAAYPSLASRSVISDTINRGRVHYLPGTKSEIEGIQKVLSDKKIHVQAYTASAANEESFKTLSGTKQNILHVATHGFYWADSTNIDPMERSGLLLAGANIALSGHSERLPKGIEDGVLTAKEISTLDLRGADIVVLSACETAQGVISGEGVFGLQRAFKMAGAQSILMALWKVDDEATKTLMTAFYRYYCQGNNKRQALRLAQQEVRKNGYSNPYYWAGFVLLD